MKDLLLAFKDLTFEQLKNAVIGFLFSAVVYLYFDIKILHSEHKSEVARKDLEIKILNQHHIEYIERTDMKVYKLEILADRIKSLQ